MNLLVLGDLNEEFDVLDRLAEVVEEADIKGVLFTGNILRAEARRQEWERAASSGKRPDSGRPEIAREREDDARSLARFFRMLHRLGAPSFLVPGKNDAPERLFLQAAYGAEEAAPGVHPVHRSFAALDSTYVVAGFGGEISAGPREHELLLIYPDWEARFSLEFLGQLEQEKILLFHTPPEPANGGEMVSFLIKTHNPAFVACARPDGRQKKELVADTLVVSPGRLNEGRYAVLNTREKKASFGDLR